MNLECTCEMKRKTEELKLELNTHREWYEDSQCEWMKNGILQGSMEVETDQSSRIHQLSVRGKMEEKYNIRVIYTITLILYNMIIILYYIKNYNIIDTE